jgi:hypothetical protein
VIAPAHTVLKINPKIIEQAFDNLPAFLSLFSIT